jgi:hypothetical protein
MIILKIFLKIAVLPAVAAIVILKWITVFFSSMTVTAGTKMDRLPVQKMNTLPPQEGLHLHQNAESLYF